MQHLLPRNVHPVDYPAGFSRQNPRFMWFFEENRRLNPCNRFDQNRVSHHGNFANECYNRPLNLKAQTASDNGDF
jgi:hypothetical protein